MGTFGAYLEQKVLDEAFGKTDFVAPTPLYFGLCTTDITSSGGEYVGKEPSTVTSYARVAITNTATNFTMAETSGGKGVKYNAVAISFPAVTCSSWAHVTYAFVSDTSSNEGNLMAWGELTVHKDLDAGDTASFAVKSFKITLD